MAFDSTAEPDIDEGFKSKFNEAFLKMHRIHKLQDTINISFMNPTAYNNDLESFNYEIIINCCSALISECWAKLNEEDRENARGMKEAIDQIMLDYPVHERKRNVATGASSLKINSNNWSVIRKELYKFNLKVREYLGEVGYDSPDHDGFDEDDF